MHQDASFELSKTVFGQFFNLFIIRGFGGVQKLPDVEKKAEKNLWKKILNQGAKLNKKMGGRSFVIICGAFMDTLQCSGATNQFLSSSCWRQTQKVRLRLQQLSLHIIWQYNVRWRVHRCSVKVGPQNPFRGWSHDKLNNPALLVLLKSD